MAEIDSLIHQPVRLRIMASLVTLGHDEQMEFTHLRELLRATDGNLGAHLQKLEDAGYISVDKAFVGRKPRTYLHATTRGRAAFQDHVDALRSILTGQSALE